MLRYIELCAGMGGTRAGLRAAGWECLAAIDNSDDAIAVHELAHGSGVVADLRDLAASDLPGGADVWVAGFPCQPFSSSGSRRGFRHGQGNVFDSLAGLIRAHNPPYLLLENVEGLLTNKGGHTFAVVLQKLTELGYAVDWALLNLRWFGPPQTRPRLFMIARKQISGDGAGREPGEEVIFAPLLRSVGVGVEQRGRGSLEEVERLVRPAIGKAHVRPPYAFGPAGIARGGRFVTFDLTAPPVLPDLPGALPEIVAPSFRHGQAIRSARYWSPKGGGGPTGLHVRADASSHCVGSSIGGAPLYAVPEKFVRSARDRRAYLEYANWNRTQDGLMVMRLRPDRAVLLFGPFTERLHHAVARWPAGDTRKYRLVGNLVAPICATAVAGVVTSCANDGAGRRIAEAAA